MATTATVTPTTIVPLPPPPSRLSGYGFTALTPDEAEELERWLDSIPVTDEQCEQCRRPANPIVDGRCLACAGELDPTLPPPWAWA